MHAPQTSIVLVPLIAVLAPLIARAFAPWLRVPIIVFEIILGIVVGPSMLGWVHPSELLDFLADIGLAMLFFVAGSEIEFRAIRGRPLARSGLGWVASLAMGLAAGWVIAPGEPAVFIAVALSSTALGTILPILRDSGDLRRPFGSAATAIGAVGEFAPLVAISVFLGVRDVGVSTFVLLGFVVVTGVGIWLATRLPNEKLQTFIASTLHTSGQFAIRVIVLAIAALVTLSLVLDLDMLLGAFAAGVLWKVIMSRGRAEDREAVDSKVEALAFGFLVPIFFVCTGIGFDLGALLAHPLSLALVPVFLVLLLITRGLPAQAVAPAGSSVRDRVSLGLFAATGLPIIVAVTAIGVDEKVLSPALASALVGAGMLSVLLYPLIAMLVRPPRVAASEPVESESEPPADPGLIGDVY